MKSDSPLYFKETGAGETVVFLHGNRDSGSVFDKLTLFLKDYFHIVSIDLRGHGKSKYDGLNFSFSDLVDDVCYCIKSLNKEKVFVVGHSLGATILTFVAPKLENVIKKNILLSTSIDFDPPFKRPKKGERIDQSVINDVNKSADKYFFNSEYPEVREIILKGWSELSPRTHELMVRINHPKLEGQFEKITQPTLLIYGQKDMLTTVENGLEINKRIPDSRLLVVPNAGHFVFMEKAQEVSKAIISFLMERENV